MWAVAPQEWLFCKPWCEVLVLAELLHTSTGGEPGPVWDPRSHACLLEGSWCGWQCHLDPVALALAGDTMICTVSLAMCMRGCGDRDGEVTMCTQGHKGSREVAERNRDLGSR